MKLKVHVIMVGLIVDSHEYLMKIRGLRVTYHLVISRDCVIMILDDNVVSSRCKGQLGLTLTSNPKIVSSNPIYL